MDKLKLSEMVNPLAKKLVDLANEIDPQGIRIIYDAAGQRNDAPVIYYIGKNYLHHLPEDRHNVIACSIMQMDRFESGSITKDELTEVLLDGMREDIRHSYPNKSPQEIDSIVQLAKLRAQMPPELVELLQNIGKDMKFEGGVHVISTDTFDIIPVEELKNSQPGTGTLDLSAFDRHPGNNTKH